jgi:hypothetical protein
MIEERGEKQQQKSINSDCGSKELCMTPSPVRKVPFASRRHVGLETEKSYEDQCISLYRK